MKVLSLASLAVGCLLLTANAFGQSARQLTRKIVPSPTNQPPARSAAPTARPAAPQTAPAVTTVPARSVDPAKARKEKEETLKKTIEFQKKRAAEGSAAAQYDLGLRYLYGDGLEKNEAEGRKWLEESAKNGSSLAKKKIEELDELKKKK